MSATAFLDRIQDHLTNLESTQLPQIRLAAGEVARAIGSGNRIWLAQTSHCLHGEATYRAGGFMAAHILEDPIVLQPGDVVIEGTPAGTSTLAIDIALQAKERGAYLIALTQRVFEDDDQILLQHPDQLRLSSIADLVIDLGGSYGDGELELLDTGVRIIPSSGITGMVAMWMIFAEAVDILTSQGLMPVMWQSMLVPGALERNAALRARYLQTGAGFEVVPDSGGPAGE
ncbi:MAG: hypothetical protein IT335_07715 [Thermomicrobiales bacterium]|nr:hypothetical protein [Thermomicrobiales bacterium]